MQVVLAVCSLLMALAWLPLARKFQISWRTRKNPVSLAICASMLAAAYVNVIYAFALTGYATWIFFGNATRVFEFVVIANFYISLRWSDMKFVGARRTDPDAPSNTPNAS